MGESKRYYWLKFKDDFFQSKRIKKLRNLGADYLIIYLKMQLKAIRTEGRLYITGIEDNIASEIALDIDEDADKVQLTLSYLQSCGLMEVSEDFIFLPYVKDATGSENASTQRVRDYRNRQKALHCNASVTEVKRGCNVEKEKDIDIDKENKKERVSSAERNEIISHFENLYQKYHTVHPTSNGKSKARDKYVLWCTKGVKGVKLTPEQIEAAVSGYVQEHIDKEDKGEWTPPYKNIDTLMNNITDYIRGDMDDNG